MTKLSEDDLEFDFSDALDAFKYDDDELHAGHNMQRVDFIAEYDECYRFIEVKDMDRPNPANPEAFMNKFRDGSLIKSLAGKYRDSYLFRTLEGRVNKDCDYIVLLAMSSLDPALILNKSDQLYKAIPIQHRAFKQDAARSCIILNFEQYRQRFGEHSVIRLSEE